MSTESKIQKIENDDKNIKKSISKEKIETKSSKEQSTNEKTINKTFYKNQHGKNFGSKRRKKFCKFCAKGIEHVDYKDVDTLKKYLNHHLKIMAARATGTCGKHQRRVSNAIKRARLVALIPFVVQD